MNDTHRPDTPPPLPAEQGVRSRLFTAVLCLVLLIVPLEKVVQNILGLDYAFGRLVFPALFSLYILLAKPLVLRVPPLAWATLPYLLVSIAHMAFQNEYSSQYYIRIYILNIFVFCLFYSIAIARPTKLPTLFCYTTTVSTLGLSIAVLADLLPINYLNDRLRFGLLDPNYLGQVFSLGTTCALSLTYMIPGHAFRRLAIAAAIPFTIAGLTATGSRGAVFSALLPAMFLAYQYLATRGVSKKLLGITIPVIVATAAIGASVIAPNRSLDRFISEAGDANALGYRDILFQASVEIILEKPLLGWGELAGWREIADRVFGGAYTRNGTHNTFLLTLVTAGLFAGGMINYLLIYPLTKWRTLAASSSGLTSLVLLLHSVASCLTLDRLTDREVWVVLAIAFASLHAGQRRQAAGVKARSATLNSTPTTLTRVSCA